jgi:hypothetical protein
MKVFRKAQFFAGYLLTEICGQSRVFTEIDLKELVAQPISAFTIPDCFDLRQANEPAIVPE